MENKHLRLVSLLLCAVMVFALVGCGASGDAEEHDHVHANEVLEQLPPTPSVTSFDDLLVPMAELPESQPQSDSAPVGDTQTSTQSEPQAACFADALPNDHKMTDH